MNTWYRRIAELLVRLTTRGAFIGGIAFSAFGQTYPLSENFWSNPEFKGRVMGSYGFHTELEPKLSEEEGSLFKELLVLLERDVEEGRQYLKRSLNADSSAALDFMLGTIELQLGNIDEAVESYKGAIKKFPNFMRAYKSAGYALSQKEDWEEAAKYMVKGLELGGGDGMTYGLLGYCYLNQEKYGAALNAYSLAIAFAPDTTDWQLGLVRCLVYMEDWRKAEGYIEDLILQDPDNHELWLHKANSSLAADSTNEAATHLEIVRRMGKSTVSSLTLLGDIYENQEMHSLAYGAYAEALAQPDGNKALLKANHLAQSFMQYGAYEYARKMSSFVLTEFGDRLEKEQRLSFLNLQAEVELALDNSDAAAEILTKIVDEDPMNGQALLLLGKHAWQKGDMEEAAFLYERAQNLDEVAYSAFLQHGQMMVQQRDYNEAVRLIRRSLDLRYSPQVADYLRNVEEAISRIY